MLRHWSARSGPPGRLFCKSNRRTGSPVVLLGSFLPSTAAAVSLCVTPSPPPPPPVRTPGSASLLASSSAVRRRLAAAILFLKNHRRAHFRTFARSFILGAGEGFDSPLRMVAPWPALLIAREGERGTQKGSKREERRMQEPKSPSHKDAALDKPRENPWLATLSSRKHHQRRREIMKDQRDDSSTNHAE